MGESVGGRASVLPRLSACCTAGRTNANTYLEEGVPVDVVNDILDCILLVHFGSQQLGCHRPVLLCLPVHLSHTDIL